MRPVPTLMILASTLGLAAQPSAPSGPLAAAWPRLQEWAGTGAPAEFEPARLQAYLEARRGDLRAGRGSAWRPWLERLAAAKSPELAAWARTRLVEAGVWEPYEALLDAAVAHLQQSTQAGTRAGVLRQPASAGGWMPGVFRIHSDSPYWAQVERQTRERPDLAVNSNLYALWCHGTAPTQRSLVFDLAAKVEAKATLRAPKADPWNDPRFWVVTDWALAWGGAEDFRTLEAQLPEGAARATFARLVAPLKDQAAFWAKAPGTQDLRRLNALGGPGAQAGPEPGEGLDLEDAPPKALEEGPVPPPPPAAQDRGLHTTVAVRVTVDPEGRVSAWRPLPGPWVGMFAPWAAPGLARWRFEPAQRDGAPRWARTLLHLRFGRDRLPADTQTRERGRVPGLR